MLFTQVVYMYILSYVYNNHFYMENININAFPHISMHPRLRAMLRFY